MTEEPSFEPDGGHQIRNKAAQLVAWFKLKNVEGCPPYIICSFHPERADSDEQKAELQAAFVEIKGFARESGWAVFDMEEAMEEIRRHLDTLAPKSRRNFEDDITVNLTNLATCQKAALTIGLSMGAKAMKKAVRNNWAGRPKSARGCEP